MVPHAVIITPERLPIGDDGEKIIHNRLNIIDDGQKIANDGLTGIHHALSMIFTA
jgi:hypothetical protein